MSLSRSIAHNTGIQIIGKALSTVLGLLGIGMMTRYLGTEQFGWYVTAISILQFIGILIDFGLIPVTAQMLSEPMYDQTKLFRNLFTFRLVTAAIFLFLTPLGALFLPYPSPVKWAILLCTISFLGVALNQILVGLYQTKLKMWIPTLGDVLGRVTLVVSLFFLIRIGASFLPIMAAVVLSAVVYTVVMLLYARREVQLGLAFDWDIWRAIIGKSWPIAISIMFNVIYLRGDVLLLSHFRSQSDVGLYGASYRVLDIVTQLAMMLMGVMLPLLAFAYSRARHEEFQDHYQRSFDMMMAVAIPATVGLAVLSQPIMTLIAGDAFAPAGMLLRILSLAVFGVFLGAVFGHTAVAVDKQKSTMWIYISNAIITLIGYLIFIPRYGGVGAAWMSVFSELYAGILLAIVLHRVLRERLRVLVFGKILLSAGIMGGVLWYIGGRLHVILLVLIGTLIYSALLILLRAVSRDTLTDILGRT